MHLNTAKYLNNNKYYLSHCIYGNAAIRICLVTYFFLIPTGMLIHDLSSPQLRNGGIAPFTFHLHKKLSKDYAAWARQRVTSLRARELSLNDISGTEWPMFSSVFYLWATESLQKAWEANPSVSGVKPTIYARDAIEVAAKLISDPNNASWVKKHWGKNYLHKENIFYRMLLISGLSSYQRLTGNNKYQKMLEDQVNSLVKEIDASPHGLLDDYPGQCYPIDILPAIAVIQRAGILLGKDYSAFVKRSLRGFSGSRLDSHTGLPAYIADSRSGSGVGPARGTGISYMLIWAPELWPEVSKQWYSLYEKHFWQNNIFVSGVREFSKEAKIANFWFDIDAGPVVFGYGTSASAFGIGAARVNGRFDQAYPLSAQALVFSWPLPNRTLLVPRLLSDWSDAPYVGEAALLFVLTRQTVQGNVSVAKGLLPISVYLGLLLYVVIGTAGLVSAVVSIKKYHSQISKQLISASKIPLTIWFLLTVGGVGLILYSQATIGIMSLLLAQFLPRIKARAR